MKRKILFLMMSLSGGALAIHKPSVLPHVPPIGKVASKSLGARLKNFLGFKPKVAPQQSVQMRQKLAEVPPARPLSLDLAQGSSRFQSPGATPSLSPEISKRNTISEQPSSPIAIKSPRVVIPSGKKIAAARKEAADKLADDKRVERKNNVADNDRNQSSTLDGLDTLFAEPVAQVKQASLPNRSKLLDQIKNPGGVVLKKVVTAEPKTTFDSRDALLSEIKKPGGVVLKKAVTAEPKTTFDSRDALLSEIKKPGGVVLKKVAPKVAKKTAETLQKNKDLIAKEEARTLAKSSQFVEEVVPAAPPTKIAVLDKVTTAAGKTLTEVISKNEFDITRQNYTLDDFKELRSRLDDETFGNDLVSSVDNKAALAKVDTVIDLITAQRAERAYNVNLNKLNQSSTTSYGVDTLFADPVSQKKQAPALTDKQASLQSERQQTKVNTQVSSPSGAQGGLTGESLAAAAGRLKKVSTSVPDKSPTLLDQIKAGRPLKKVTTSDAQAATPKAISKKPLSLQEEMKVQLEKRRKAIAGITKDSSSTDTSDAPVSGASVSRESDV